MRLLLLQSQQQKTAALLRRCSLSKRRVLSSISSPSNAFLEHRTDESLCCSSSPSLMSSWPLSLHTLSSPPGHNVLLRQARQLNNTSKPSLGGWNGRRWHSTAAMDESSSSSSGVIPFLLADIGEGIAEVELLQWFVHEGDQVRQFDRICEVQSDKATVEITSRYDGHITSLEHAVGDMVKVGSPLLFLQEEGGASGGGGSSSSSSSDRSNTTSFIQESVADEAKKEAAEPMLSIPTIASKFHLQSDNYVASASQTADATGTSNVCQKIQTTPAIRKLAKEYDLDLSTIVGTGPQGRVLKGDVLTVLRERGLMAPPPKTTATAAVSAETMTSPLAASSSTPSRPAPGAETPGKIKDIQEIAGRRLTQDTTMDIRGYNRLMVQSMTASLQIPHMVFADEINVNAVLQHKLPLLPLAVKAMSRALLQYPLLNASYNGDTNSITLWKDHNIGIAMDTPRGLIVPVIKQCQDKSLSDILDDLKRLKELAQQPVSSSSGGVPAEDLQGATITLSNIGAIGAGTYMSPIVTAPQVAIGAIGAIQRLPRFVSNNDDGDDDKMEVYEANVCNISWGGDHRVIDGATMARFHKLWKSYMEDPMTLIRDLK